VNSRFDVACVCRGIVEHKLAIAAPAASTAAVRSQLVDAGWTQPPTPSFSMSVAPAKAPSVVRLFDGGRILSPTLFNVGWDGNHLR
jgi:hypothetical protein